MDYFYIVIGIMLAGGGGELFVRGALGLANWARVPAGIIGSTIAAFATSSPEFSVAVNSALSKKPQIALGDALGSNVVNICFILGIALLMGNMKVEKSHGLRDYSAALLIPIITAVFILDGMFSRVEGIILAVAFIIWLSITTYQAWKERSAAVEVLGEIRRWQCVVQLTVGLIMLVLAGRVIVLGAEGVGQALKIDKFIVGVLFVAIGTSAPELATTIISRLRKHDEIGLGTILGSNIFNGAFIISVAAVICPFELPVVGTLITLVVGIIAVLMTIPGKNHIISRWRGIFLLLAYALYLAIVLYTR